MQSVLLFNRRNNNLKDAFSVDGLGTRFGSVSPLNSLVCIYYGMHILLLRTYHSTHANI